MLWTGVGIIAPNTSERGLQSTNGNEGGHLDIFRRGDSIVSCDMDEDTSEECVLTLNKSMERNNDLTFVGPDTGRVVARPRIICKQHINFHSYFIVR